MWAQIYYLFRTGHVQDALQFARDNELNLNPADRNFVMYLNAYWQSEDRTLPSTLQDRLRTDFNNRIRYSSDTVDPYKLTLFKIIGQCELTKRTTPVIGAVEDFIWLHVSRLRDPFIRRLYFIRCSSNADELPALCIFFIAVVDP